jgi:glycosyltransferase involved in cell wall biosynthesis
VREQGQEAGVTWDVQDAVIYNAIDFSQYSQDFDSKIARQIIFVGSLEESKGVILLIKAINYLSTEVDKVLWIGRGSLEEKIPQLMRSSKSKSELYGFVENKTVMRLMSESDLLVVPSASESFGLVYIEALFAGTPVIGYDRVINEFRQSIGSTGREQDWMTPFRHDRESPKDLAEKISHGMEIKKRSTYYAEARSIRQKITGRFSWERISKEYEQVYEVVKSKKTA